jgi:serine protease Do
MRSRSFGLPFGCLLAWVMLIALVNPRSQVRGDEPDRRLTPAELSRLLPKGAEDLKALDSQTREVVEKVIPATVAVDGGGSGVIVSEDGYVVTVAHVALVAGRKIPVILHDGRRLTGVTLGLYRNHDAALVKITDKGPWPFAPLADPATVKAGSWCLGIGHPHGFRLGRSPVVRLGRVLQADGDSVFVDLITDGGDSGGPLFDLSGKVVGVDHGGDTRTDGVFYTSAGVFRRHWDRLAKAETWGERSDWTAGATNKDDFKASPKVLAAFRSATAEARKSTVRIRCGEKVVALGTVVGPCDLVLTRWGALKGTIEVLSNDDKVYKARVIGVHPDYDLAMLKIDAAKLPAVTFADAKTLPPGHWVASAGIGEKPISYGVVSVAARDPRKEKPLLPLVEAPILITGGQDGASALVNRVLLKKETDLQGGDVILRVGGKVVADRWVFSDALRDYKAGDTVELTVRRGKVESKARMRLVSPPEPKQSYPFVLQHDAHIRPDECGGPLVDLDGRMVGLNVARPWGYQSYAIPVEALKPLLRDLASGKLAPRVKGDEREE